MSYKHYRQAWVIKTYADAVQLFHEARKDNPDNVPLPDLARQCANTAFQWNAESIVGDKEVTAREFMAYCRDHFGTELSCAIAEQAQFDIESRQRAEREAAVN